MAQDASPLELLEGLRRSTAQEGPPRACILQGPERWLRREALEILRAAARERKMEVCSHDADDPDFDLQGLHGDLLGGSLFASERLVVLWNPGNLIKKQAGEDAPVTRTIISFLKRNACRDHLVLVADTLRADHAVAKAVKVAGGRNLKLRNLWASELPGWLRGRAASRGLKLAMDEITYLLAATGPELDLLDTELEKLKASGGGRLRDLIGVDAPDRHYAVAEALCAGNLAAACAGIETFFLGGLKEKKSGRRVLDPPALANILLGTLRRSLRQHLAIARGTATGADFEQAADAAGVPNWPSARRSLRSAVNRRSPEQWEQLYHELAELERRGRSGARVDENDLFRLALRWRRSGQARSR